MQDWFINHDGLIYWLISLFEVFGRYRFCFGCYESPFISSVLNFKKKTMNMGMMPMKVQRHAAIIVI